MPGSSLKAVRAKLKELDIGEDLLQRARSMSAFPAAKKKRNEIFQMAMLEPRLAILDETDSGLDIDALRVVARWRSQPRQRAPDRRDRHDHPLPAPAFRLCRARPGACAAGRPHRPVGRQRSLAVEAQSCAVTARSATPHDRGSRPRYECRRRFPRQARRRDLTSRSLGRVHSAGAAGSPTGCAEYRKRSSPASPSWGFRLGAARLGVISICARSSKRRCQAGAPQRRRRRAQRRAPAGRDRKLARCDIALSSSTVASHRSFSAIDGTAGRACGLARWRRRSPSGRIRQVATAIESPPLDASSRRFAALNAAFFADGFVLDIRPVDHSRSAGRDQVHLASGETGGSSCTPAASVGGRGGRAASRLIETFAGYGSCWRNDHELPCRLEGWKR